MEQRNDKECLMRERHYHSDHEVCLDDACIGSDVQSAEEPINAEVVNVCGILQPFLSCSEKEIIIPADGSAVEFSVKSSSALEVIAPEGWNDGTEDKIELDYDKSVGKTVFKISSDDNGGTIRSTSITFRNRYGSITIPVMQMFHYKFFVTADGMLIKFTNGVFVTKDK